MANSQDRLMLPWSVEESENRQFSIVSVLLLVVFLVFAIWIPTIELPEPDRETLEALPPQLAKLVVKKEPPKVVQPEPTKPEPEPEAKPEKKAPEPKPEKLEPKTKPKPKPQTVKQAREVAKQTGLLALQSSLADLRNDVNLDSLKQPQKKLRVEKTIAAKPSAITSDQVLKTSGGIETSNISAPAETIQLAAASTTELEQTQDEIDLAKAEAAAALRQNQRSEESIRLSFETAKKALIKLYNRELRKNPFLEGLVTFEVVIEASGEVSYCRIVESALNHAKLESKFINRIKLHNFGAESVDRKTTRFNISFQPN